MDPKNASLPGYQPGTYLTGPAIHPRELANKSITISGTLSAPFDFIAGRPELVVSAKENIRLEIDNEDKELHLVILDNGPFTTHEITGKLLPFSDLLTFGINTDKRWTVKNLINHCRMYKFYFSDRSACDAMIRSLQQFTAKLETIIKKHNDDSGNTLNSLETKLEGVDVTRKFSLTIPIYKGYRQNKFTVDVCLEPKGGNVVEFFFISDELALAERTEAEVIMADELKKFDGLKFSKVVVS